MKKLILSLMFAIAPTLAFAHDGHDQPGFTHLMFNHGALHAHCTWKQGPTGNGESILLIEWKNGADHLATEPPGAFDVSLLMPSMPEMHNPPTQIQRVLDTQGNVEKGSYQVSNIYFTMSGDWDVQVSLHYPDGTQETQAIHVDVDDGMDMGHSGHMN